MGTRKPYLVLVFTNLINAGMVLLSKASFDEGMNPYVFIFYRQLLGTMVLLPIAAIFERKESPKLSFSTFWKIFMLGFLGITLPLSMFNIAIIYTTATLGPAVINCLPVMTFILAVFFRMEKVNIRAISGMTKIVGMIICMAGVAVLAIYKGPHLEPLFHRHLFQHQTTQGDKVPSQKSWIKGCFLLLIADCAWALWYVLQVPVLKSYPSKLMFTTLQCISSAVQSFFLAIAMERRRSKWELHRGLDLLTILYCGLMVNVVMYYLQTWVVEKKGPVFPAMSLPLALLFTTIGSVLLLGETVSLGSTIGEILLVISLYIVLWAKSKEQNASPAQEEKGIAEPRGSEIDDSNSKPPSPV